MRGATILSGRLGPGLSWESMACLRIRDVYRLHQEELDAIDCHLPRVTKPPAAPAGSLKNLHIWWVRRAHHDTGPYFAIQVLELLCDLAGT